MIKQIVILTIGLFLLSHVDIPEVEEEKPVKERNKDSTKKDPVKERPEKSQRGREGNKEEKCGMCDYFDKLS